MVVLFAHRECRFEHVLSRTHNQKNKKKNIDLFAFMGNAVTSRQGVGKGNGSRLEQKQSFTFLLFGCEAVGKSTLIVCVCVRSASFSRHVFVDSTSGVVYYLYT